MKLSNGPRLDDRSTSRAAIFALMLSAFSACDSKQKDSPQPQTTTSASASAVASASAAPANSAQKAPLGPIENPVICVNGSLSNGNQYNVYDRIQDGFASAGASVARVNPANFERLKDGCNAIMAVGGKDIDTTKIPQKASLHPKAKLISAERQKFDEMFIRWARKNKVPIFGECLGAQEVAVWEGEGAQLIQHIPGEDVPQKVNHRGNHTIDYNEKASIFGYGSSVNVKSNHYQAPRDPLPPTLEVVGRTADGLIDSFISTDGLAWGIQWHPRPGQQQIYKNFASLVKEKGYRSAKAMAEADKKRRNMASPAKGAETVDVGDSSAPGKKCPTDMVNVKDEFCIDRYESSLVDTKQHRAVSPYYSPKKSHLLRDFNSWSKKAGTSKKPEGSTTKGPLLDSILKVPSPYAWQMKEDVPVMALSRKGAIPNGYLSQDMARQACENVAKRLCTKREWKKACRGEEDRNHPYGEKYQRGQCNVFRWAHPAQLLHGDASTNHLDPRLNLVKKGGSPLLRRTGSTIACVSKWGNDGVYDMVGNIDEWVGDSREFKGGFYSRSTKLGCEATYGAGHGKGYYDYSLGARCCK